LRFLASFGVCGVNLALLPSKLASSAAASFKCLSGRRLRQLSRMRCRLETISRFRTD
jgi:hypothetical protein